MATIGHGEEQENKNVRQACMVRKQKVCTVRKEEEDEGELCMVEVRLPEVWSRRRRSMAGGDEDEACDEAM